MVGEKLMKPNLSFAIALPLLVVACVSTQTLSPLTLHLYDVAKGEVLLASASNDGTGHGSIEIALPGGGRAVGEYTTMPGGISGWGKIYGLVYADGSLASAGGQQTFTIQPNEQQGSFVAVSDSGTAIECEYVVNLLNHGHGACKDNQGVVYKLLY